MLSTALTDEYALQGGPAEDALPSVWVRVSARLTTLVMVLTCVGLVVVTSAAGGRGFAAAALKRLALTGLGIGAFVLGANLPYQWWRRHSLAVLTVALLGLVAPFMPGIGVTINGASRWVNPGLPIGFQPSEFAKVALCIWVAAYCERNATRMRSAVHGFLVPLGVVGAACFLVLIEPDFGTAVLMGTICMTVLLVFGMRLLYLGLAAAAGAPLLVQMLVLKVPYRLQRLLTYQNPWRDPQGSGYQLIQSKIAIGSGGLFGRGLGAGLQKAGFLPGADNDFIFSILAEELGLVGCLAVVLLFLFLLWECLRVILRARDPFGFALGLGVAWLLGMQAAAHIAVVTGSVPTKGLSLPFISAGGSSLLASMLAAGILVNIARSEEDPEHHALKPWHEDMPGYERFAHRALDKSRDACIRAGQRMWHWGGASW